MSYQENGLNIVVFPPEGEKIAPNSNSITTVNITNLTHRHNRGIRLEVSLELTPQLQQWCKKRSYTITILYQQSQAIEFSWNIPPQAIPGTYNYRLRIKSLRSPTYSFDFQLKPRRLTILRQRIERQIDLIEPSFTITPASNSTNPITLASGIPLILEIEVHNRSHRTDNFRISTDLESAWYTIHYPETFKKVGAVDGTNALNLNPKERGKITLTLNPPANAVAGNYRPEIKLYSLIAPDLFLKKIVYLNIAPQYLLQAELQTILNKVSYKPGQYKIVLTNQGNTFREIALKASSTDEDECCEYTLDPSTVRLPPNKTVEVKLEVKANAKQKRPFLTTKQFNFQVELIDKKNLPLPKNLPLKSSLFWRSRPFWQSLLLFLLALGLLGGCGWFIWQLINKPPAKVTLKAEKKEYPFKIKRTRKGDFIAVEWTLENPETIDKVVIFDKEKPQDTLNSKCYVFEPELEKNNCYLIDKFKATNDNSPDYSYGKCKLDNNLISCNDVIFKNPQQPKNYTFQLQAFTKKNQIIEKETKEVSILERPVLEISESLVISPNKSAYTPQDSIELKFKVSDITNFIGNDKISLIIDNEIQDRYFISANNIKNYCSAIDSDRYSYQCTLKIPSFTDGEHTLGIEIEYDPDGLIKTEPKSFSAPKTIIVQTPIKFNYFSINGRSNPQIEVEPNTPITTIQIAWSVTGKEAKANISCIPENIESSGTKSIQILPGKSQSCTLTASDIHNNSITPKTITVFVKEPPEPEPEPEELKEPKKLQESQESEKSKTVLENPFDF